jgi:hypothetical protein
MNVSDLNAIADRTDRDLARRRVVVAHPRQVELLPGPRPGSRIDPSSQIEVCSGNA